MIEEHIINLILIFGGTVSSFLLAYFICPIFISLLIKLKISKRIRTEASSGKAILFNVLHKHKAGTPTMGGILIWVTTLIIVLATRFISYIGVVDHSLINRKETYLPIFTLVTLGLLGAVDDYFNIRGWGKSHGINMRPKFLWLTFFAALGSYWFYFKLGYDTIHIPFFGDYFIGLWYIPLFIFIIIASANSVNFTDGLDGLAGGLSILALLSLGIIAYSQGLLILTAFCGVLIGALLAFLWFNIPPAKFFMGDTGSIALGGTMGVIAMLTNSVVVFPLIMFIFVIETLSIIIQLTSKKLRNGKKVFYIAPIHHHFEHIGWPAHQVTMRFWIIGAFFAGLGTLLGITQI
ncbi:MAG: phospho-N-acetylmuramoyl-pentapeptide-transferase [Candidatus Peregrinibacteria bacterium]|nr:phospho-N-acetylmuramoyl-pentapeptide-transferase [Candidatus Peregrinibacteria bacterium]MDZ4244988.1 phospho-N-acetylmuramoyl-pentapeptide-transferase [Candidatus Gracilibacteria bacterium]